MTIEQSLLKNLPDNLALMAIEEAIRQGWEKDLQMEEMEKHALISAFVFSETTDIHFWGDINNKYFNF